MVDVQVTSNVRQNKKLKSLFWAYSVMDPIPTSLLKIVLTKKRMRPPLKKPSRPTNELKNTRPVSNLSFISKILE